MTDSKSSQHAHKHDNKRHGDSFKHHGKGGRKGGKRFDRRDGKNSSFKNQNIEEELHESKYVAAAEAAAADSAAHRDEPPRTFAELGVPRELVDALERDGKTTAFPIQADTLPDSLAGRDILGRGQTGSGKTLAFSIPLIARLAQSSDADDAIRDFNAIKNSSDKDARKKAMLPHPRALVLAPTRELVNQIDEVIRPLAEVYGIRTVTIYGGVRQGRQVDGLRRGAQIVVACPGRLEDLLNQKLLSLESVRVAVLDEADEMADMGFLPSVEKLLAQVAPDGQRMLFSATLDHGVDKLVDEFLHEPKVHAVDAADAQVDTLTQHVFKVTKDDKPEVIRALASGKDKRIIFTRTKYQAKELAEKLVKHGIPAVDLQGNLSQKQRDHHLAAFERGFVRVLVATDVAARGIDVSDVALVIQTEPPADPKSFLHRSGRTARAGEHGDVVTLVLPNQRRSSHRLFHNAGIDAKPVAVTPESPELLELVGEVAPVVEGWDLGQVDFGNKHGKSGKNGKKKDGGKRKGRHDRDDKDRRDHKDRHDKGGAKGKGYASHGHHADDARESFDGFGQPASVDFAMSEDYRNTKHHGHKGAKDAGRHKHSKDRFDRGAGRRDDDMRDFDRSFRDGEMPQRHSGRRISSYDEGPHNRKQRREREFGQRSGGWRHAGKKHRDDVRFVSAKHGKKTKASKKSKPAGKYHSGKKHAGGKKHR